jgi:hypothetical protein
MFEELDAIGYDLWSDQKIEEVCKYYFEHYPQAEAMRLIIKKVNRNRFGKVSIRPSVIFGKENDAEIFRGLINNARSGIVSFTGKPFRDPKTHEK